ncbi:hypothetical protein [Pelagimonas varians]|uniref:Uncharacterized protein n=1 Tax=Pelagimonas varians TaxID=696760 RepID=A0A238K9G9_9RHOB|nr:hypothetical protein [Pelagimonas varians]PYG31769.1 hypothetical protein C8N36_104189 [Pelagimonas varians]SMX38616.1 hypothetical protein PEV8663_01455 [Pelagimonas varians]
MTRNLFHRDFTLPRAGVLVLLIVMALAAGQIPAPENTMAQGAESGVRLIPAVIQLFGADCVSEDIGVQL